MNKNYTSIITLFTILFFGALSAQETQKNFINYQGVARNAGNELMADESMNITIGVKFGAANASAVYEENHNIDTDANGVFSLLIGNGSTITGNYNTLPWGSAATFVTVSMNGTEIGTTEMMAVPYAISAGSMEDPSATEVLYDNSASGLTATTAQDAIDELVTGGSVDADADPSNEFQMLSFDAGTNELSLSDGNAVTIPSGGTDADADPTNEIQTISFDVASNKISLTDGGEITIPSGGTDADADPTNELQDISLTGTELTITDGSTIDFAPIIPPGGTDDQNLTFNEATKMLEIEDGNTVDLSSLSGGGSGSSLWSEDGGDIYYDSGKVGIGTNTPQTSLSIETDGSNWNLNDTEGDFRIGNATHRLKMSTSTGGAGAGNSRIRSQGGSNKLLLGSGTDDVLTVVDQKVGIGTLDPTAPLDVAGKNNWDPNSTEGDLRIGNDTYRLKVGVALGGAGAGDTRIRTEGGTNRMMLGGGTNDVLTVTETNVGVGTITPTASLDVLGDIRSSDLAGPGERNVMADADGNLVIGAGGGGSSQWTADATGINYTTGSVGIGTASTFAPLSVDADFGLSISLTSSIPENYVTYNNSTGYVGYSGVYFDANDMDFGTGLDNASGKVHLTTQAMPQLTVATDGDVGIGTTEPTAKTHVIHDSNLGSPQLRLEESESDYARLEFKNESTGYWHIAGRGGDTGDVSRLNFYHHNGTSGRDYMTIAGSGNVGVGTTEPTTKFDVNGEVRVRDLSGPGQRNVMADANGNLVIGTSAGGGSSLWGQNGGNIHYATGNVGIGTTSPIAKLEVNGDIKTSGEVHGPTTGMANMIPVAYGRVSSSGTIIFGSNNFTVSPSSAGVYFITIPGFSNEEVREMAIIATRINFVDPPGFIGTGSGISGGNPSLIVNTYDMAGVAENIVFSFVAYSR